MNHKVIALALVVALLTINFVAPVPFASTFPHKSWSWTWQHFVPLPIQVAQASVREAGVRVAVWTNEDFLRALAAALVGMMARNFVNGLGRLIERAVEARNRAVREERERGWDK